MSQNDNFIKHVKPRKNSKYHQGYVNSNYTKKLFTSCKDEPIIYRSGLEYKFIQFCENSPQITKWASEPIKIPYYSRLKKGMANYYPDYIIENNKGKKIIVEVKPKEQCRKPCITDNDWLKENWIKNTDKWAAAKEFAEKHDMKFIIVTEDFFK